MSRKREHTLRDTRGNTVGTAPPHLTQHTGAPPTAAGHRHCSDDPPPRTRDANPAPAIRKGGDDTVAPRSPPLAEAPDKGRQTNSCGPAVNRDDPGRAELAPKDILVQPDKTRPRNTLHQRLSVGHAGGKCVDLPNACNGHPGKMC